LTAVIYRDSTFDDSRFNNVAHELNILVSAATFENLGRFTSVILCCLTRSATSRIPCSGV
jgi:hypothetical protein